jgi:hypothetical protein
MGLTHPLNFGRRVRVLGGMLGQLKTNPRMRKELEDSGYSPYQIPSWVSQLLPSTGPLNETPVPRGTPKVTVATKSPQGTSDK